MTRAVEQAGPATLASKGGRALDAEQIYARDAPGVAFIKSSGITTETPLGPSRGAATGSGFLLDAKGHVLTNAHVVDGAKQVTIRFGGEGTAMRARVVGKDDSNDLAVL